MHTSALRLREYRPGDLDAMFRLDEICFEPQFRFSHAAMRRFAEAPNAHVIVGEVEDVLAGFCIVHREERRGQRTGYVVTLDVAPEQRRKGVASILMRQTEEHARLEGCTAMLLHVFSGNTTAIRFYEREGYSFQQQANNFYRRGDHALLYSKLLNQPEQLS